MALWYATYVKFKHTHPSYYIKPECHRGRAFGIAGHPQQSYSFPGIDQGHSRYNWTPELCCEFFRQICKNPYNLLILKWIHVSRDQNEKLSFFNGLGALAT